MSYIGNQVTSVPFTVDTFIGNGSSTAFGPMVRAPAAIASVAVFDNGIYKTPGIDFSISGTTITFTSAPGSGNNIVVHHIGNGIMATQVPVDGSVTGAKMTANSIRGNNIVAGQVSGNLLGQFSVSSNNFSSTANVAIVGRGIAAAIVFGG